MTIIPAILLCAATALHAQNDTVRINSFRISDAFAPSTLKPVMIDSINPQGHTFVEPKTIDATPRFELVTKSALTTDSLLPATDKNEAVRMLHFEFANKMYGKASVKVSGLANAKVYIDEKETGNEIALTPKSHSVVIKYVTRSEKNDTANVQLLTTNGMDVTVYDPRTTYKKMYSPDVYFNNLHVRTNRFPSPDGQYVIIEDVENTYTYTQYTYIIQNIKTGAVRATVEGRRPLWQRDKSHTYTVMRKVNGHDELYAIDAETLNETLLCKDIPGRLTYIAPDFSFAITTSEINVDKPNDDMRMYLNPEDRLNGWRQRSYINYVDLRTGMSRQLTYGYRNTRFSGISDNGRNMLFITTTDSLPMMRPTKLFSLCRLNLETMQIDTLVANDGFLSSAQISPDGSKVAIKASAEFANRIGCTLPANLIPNEFDYRLYIMDIETRKLSAIAPDGEFSIEEMSWSRYDGQLYFTALDHEYKSLFRVNSNNKVESFNLPKGYINGWDLSGALPMAAVSIANANNFGVSYYLNTKTGKTTLIEDMQLKELGNYAMPEVHEYSFVNKRGETIHGFYLLPTDFDPTKQYPVIMDYYGGCSPKSRYFNVSYPFTSLASQGYIIYTINPAGAAGFGQHFASMHVNTYGDPQVDDIVEGVERFCAEHPWANRQKVGCIGASYGGFLTQWLQCKTEGVFAAAISHAGISNFASYWGLGNWGYTYSQTCSAGTYPWTRKDLYVDHSPLFNVDKIHTPILFTHGTADDNVPMIESIQMFTALNLLDRPTAFVSFKGDGHGIGRAHIDNWQKTIMAWFARYLKDDPTWWNTLYKKPNL